MLLSTWGGACGKQVARSRPWGCDWWGFLRWAWLAPVLPSRSVGGGNLVGSPGLGDPGLGSGAYGVLATNTMDRLPPSVSGRLIPGAFVWR